MLAKELEDIKSKEMSGYKVYYGITKRGHVKYNLEMAKKAIERNVGTKFEEVLFEIIGSKNGNQMESFLRRYDYNKVARTENAKCSIVFLVMLKDAMELVYKDPGVTEEMEEILDAFTCRRESWATKGRDVTFYEVTGYIKHVTDLLRLDDGYFNACMDYIMTTILAFKL